MTSLMMKRLQDPKYYIIVSVFLVLHACNHYSFWNVMHVCIGVIVYIFNF